MVRCPFQDGLLDGVALRVPFEGLSRGFRKSQKLVDRGLTSVVEGIEQLRGGAQGGTLDPAAALGSIQELRAQLQDLRSQVARLQAEQEASLGTLSQRLTLTVGGTATASVGPAPALAPTTPTSVGAGWNTSTGGPSAAPLDVEALVGTHLLRQGHTVSGSAVLSHASDRSRALTDATVYEEVFAVARSLQDHNTGPALVWCKDNGSKLRRIGSSLEFRIRKQEFIELVRGGNKAQAAEYASTHLAPAAIACLSEDASHLRTPLSTFCSPILSSGGAPASISSPMPPLDLTSSALPSALSPLIAEGSGGGAGCGAAAGGSAAGGTPGGASSTGIGTPGAAGGASNPLVEVQQAMSLLAFPNPLQCGVRELEDLFGTAHWTSLTSAFVSDAFTACGLGECSPLRVALVAGLVALKQHSCSSSCCSGGAPSSLGRGECPTCCPHFAALVDHLPQCKRVQGRVLCSLSGDSISEANPAVVLPDGHVCGLAAVAAQQTSPGTLVNPFTGDVVPLGALRRAFFL